MKNTEMPHQGAWLVYLNGVLVPCPSVNVSYGVGAMPEATLSFPPHRLLQRLGVEDRLDVTVFYLDDLADPANPEFRILFEGEIIGWSYTSSSHGRQMTFNAVADISVFTQIHFFFLNNVSAVVGHALEAGNSPGGVAQPGAVWPFSLFKKGLIFREVPKDSAHPVPDVTRPFEILYNVVRGMLDHELSAARRAVPSVGFFSRWARKRNFQNRFAALPIFEDEGADGAAGVFPILQAAQATAAMQAMQDNIATGVGDAGTMMEVLNGIFGHVFFEISMLPTAACARVRLSDGQVLGPSSSDPSNRTKPELEPLRLLNYMVKPQMIFGIPPTCNVMFPAMVSNYSYAENYMVQPTRTYVNDTFISSAMGSANPFTTAALTFGFPEEIDVVLRAEKGDPQAAAKAAKNGGKGPAPGNNTQSGKNVLLFPEEQYKGMVMHRMSIPAWFSYLKNKEPTGKPTPETTEESRSIHQLMQSYVSYEHFRARYEKRGGAVNMAWNPYVVPGYPCVVFDQKASSFHTVGYLQNVMQTLSLDGMSTAINYSFSRTVPEMLDLLQSELVKYPGRIFGSAPVEPVAAVRDIVQDFTKAEQFYNALFFQRKTLPPGGKKASFDFREVLGYDNGDGTTDPIELSDTVDQTPGATLETAEGETLSSVTRVNTLVGDRNVVPLKGFVPVFNSYDTAMKYVARPICSITDYLRFLHGEKPLSQLLEPDESVDGTIVQAQVEAGDKAYGKAVYFKRIKRLRQGPGERPPPAALGVTGAGATSEVFVGTNIGGPADFPQTRADWDTVLENYRAEMVNRQGPQE